MLVCLDQSDSLEFNCTIHQVADEAEANALARRTFAPGCGQVLRGWEPGSFGDCWVKLHHAPDELDADGLADLDGIKCRVAGPGQHPGGRAWWYTPAEEVYVPVLEPEPTD